MLDHSSAPQQFNPDLILEDFKQEEQIDDFDNSSMAIGSM